MKIIACLDMDAFFAQVEERENPQFKEKPVIVGSDPKNGKGRGVVSTANYIARQLGIYSGMPISLAYKICPEGIFVLPNISFYQKVWANIIKIVKNFSPKIEKASIDECYFDLTFLKDFTKAANYCKEIKKEIKKRERLTCSIGIGKNKVVAKIASGFHKPNGLTIVEPKKTREFLKPLPINKIPGVGKKTEEFLHKKNIFTIGDLQNFDREKIIEYLGKRGVDIYNASLGFGDDKIEEKRNTKSIGNQETFPFNTLDANFILLKFNELCKKVYQGFLEKHSKHFRTIKIIVRFQDFQTITVSKTFKKELFSLKDLKIEGIKLLLPYLDSRKNKKRKLIRLIGLRLEKLS